MSQDLFRVELGFADDNIHYLSGAGAPAGAQADAAPLGSSWTNSTNGDVYTKRAAGWDMLTTASGTIDAYTKTETDTRIQAVIGAAPAALDTLKEIADALNNDASAVATLLAGQADAQTKVTAANVTTAAGIDTLNGITNVAVKWIVVVKGRGTDLGKVGAVEVMAAAAHNGTALTQVDYTAYAKLKVGGAIAGLSVAVDMTGANMRLMVASTHGVDVSAVREVIKF